MADEEFNQWDLADGFGLDNVDVDVTNAEFTINNSLGHGNLCLALTFVPRNGEDTKVEFFSMGPGWRASDGGRGAESEEGKPKKISKQSRLGIMLKSIEQSIGRDAVMELGNPILAATWAGTSWHVIRQSRMVTNPTTGVEKESSTVTMDAYLGRTQAVSAKATTSTPAKVTSSNGNGAGEWPKGLLATLTDLARASESEDAFLEAAAQLEEVRGDRNVQRALYGDGFFNGLTESVAG